VEAVTIDIRGLSDRELRRLLREEWRERIDSVWHAVYRGELDEKGVACRVEDDQEAARLADSGARRFLLALTVKVRTGGSLEEALRKRRGVAPRIVSPASIKALRNARRRGA
jgi:hypothetical protein